MAAYFREMLFKRKVMDNNQQCLICDRIQLIKDNNNPYFVIELETGYVVLGDYQFFRGYSQFLCEQHKLELHFLDKKLKKNF